MTGGLLQLSAVGKQDIFLIGRPQFNWFKKVYRRYINFALEEIRQSTVGEINFGKRFHANISRSGDLVTGVALSFKLPALTIPAGSTYVGWTNNLAHALVKEAELEIGGNRIDKLYSVWMDIWDELTTTEDKRDGINRILGKFETASEVETNATEETDYYLPFPFWFYTEPALALPLLALQYHEVKVTIQLREFSEVVVFDGPTAPDAVNIISGGIFVQYVFLEDTERAKWAQNSHTYLITQVQQSDPQTIGAIGSSESNYKTRLAFNHVVKELVWVLVETDSIDNNDYFNYSRRSDTSEQINKARILVDGDERLEIRDEKYFRLIQPIRFHTHTVDKHIYVYSFALNPEADAQPAGGMNFSMFDSVELQLKMRASNPATNLYVYGTNFNVLIIKNGMASLAYTS